MAIRTGVRFKPTIYKSTMSAVNAGLNAVSTPPSGTIIRTVQLFGYDDTKVGTGGNPYVAGLPESEVHIYVLDESTVQIELAAIDGKTQAQVNAIWAQALADYKTAIAPAVPNLLKSEIGVFNAGFSLY